MFAAFCKRKKWERKRTRGCRDLAATARLRKEVMRATSEGRYQRLPSWTALM
jgi:hypothetical protein